MITFKSNYKVVVYLHSAELLDTDRVKNRGRAQCQKGIALILIFVRNQSSLSQFTGEMQAYNDNVYGYKINYLGCTMK